MNTKQAIDSIRTQIESAPPERLADISTVLELGAGNIFMADRADKRPSVIMELTDAVVYSTCDSNDNYQPEAPFIPCYAGSWELVLASLVIDQDWPKIAETARDLRETSPRR